MGPGSRPVGVLCAIAIAGCGESSPVRIELTRLAPPAQPECGAASDVRSVTIRALGEFPADESTAQTVSADGETFFRIERFPAELEALEVEVRGLGGAVRAVGRTGSIDLDADPPLAAPVFLAEVEGGCATGSPAVARSNATVVPIEGGALIVGGRAEGGEPLAEVERYHRASGTFESLGEPLFGSPAPAGVAGASVTALADGRVVVVGGGSTAYQVFDPGLDEFSPARFLPEARGRHAAAELPGGRVLLAGGCSQLTEEGCAVGSGLLTTSILDPEAGALEPGPRLDEVRIGGRAFRVDRDRVVLAGGTDGDGNASTSAELLDLAAGTSETLDGAVGRAAAQLHSGAVVALLAGEAASVATPRGQVGALDAPPVTGEDGVALTLESGEVFVVAGEAAIMRPIDGTWRSVDAGEPRHNAGAALLEDGSVLLVGGTRSDGSIRDDAYLFRPDLFGRLSSDVAITFGAADLAAAAVVTDPAAGTLESDDDGAFLRLEGGGQRVVIAGPVLATGHLEAGLSVVGGVALLWGFAPDGSHLRAELVPGEEARVHRVGDDGTEVMDGCNGAELAADALAPTPAAAPAHSLAATIDPSNLRIEIDGATVIDCVPTRTWSRGSLGFEVVGAADSALRLDVVAVRR